MRSKADAARYRLSAVHPEMSHLEQERCASRLAHELDPAELRAEGLRITEALAALWAEEARLRLQSKILVRADEFQRRRNGR